MMRWLIGVAVAAVMAVGSAGTASAFDFDDLTDWMDECNLGDFLNSALDGLAPANGIMHRYIGTTVRFGECTGEAALADFWMPEKPGSLRWAPGSTVTNGKLMVDVQRVYAFDLNGNPDTFEYTTGAGNIWRWKKASMSEYFKANYTLGSKIVPPTQTTSGKIQMSMTGSAVPGTGSMAPLSYNNTVNIASGMRLENIGKDTYNVNRYKSGSIWYVTKRLRGKTFLRDGANRRHTINVELNKVVVRSVPRNGKLHQHIVYRLL